MEIQFQSRWFEKCIREYLGIADRALTAEDVSVIRYLYVSTTNGYFLGFGRGGLPEAFAFSDAGDEWDCCCLSDTGEYHAIEEFINIREWEDHKELSIKRELLEKEEEEEEWDDEDEEWNDVDEDDEEWDDEDTSGMQDFENSVKIYEAKERDFEGLIEDETAYNYGILIPEDFAHLTNLEVVRLMSCEMEIHSLAFLKALPKIRVLEVGEVRLNTLEGLEKLIGLEKLCIWAN